MKKSELKAVLKPIIEECLRESFVENGFLGKVITEVIRASQEVNTITEQHDPEVFVPRTLPTLPAKTPKKDTPRIRAAKELESAGYFEGITLPSVVAATPKSTIVEGINAGVLPIDDFASRPGLPEDLILALMGKK